MKKNLLFLIFFAVGSTAFCQPGIKAFAFQQENLPGTIAPGVKDENGNPIKKDAAKKNYFIFLSFKKTYNITPIQIFIKDQVFSVQKTDRKKTPVEYSNNTISGKPEKVMLVPKTSNRVLGLTLTEPLMRQKKKTYVQKLLNTNDVVVIYLWKSKKYFITVKKIKELEPVTNE